jgi:hypothetical protein
MITPKLSEVQFDAISRHINTNGVELLVSDFNGVLDDYYGTKYEFLASVLGPQHRDQHFARLALQTDTAYISDRSATLEGTITSYCANNAITISRTGQALLETGPRKPEITGEAKKFLGDLTVPTVIFTAQSSERLYQSVGQEFLEDLGIGVVTSVAKPSVDALAAVLSARNTVSGVACMVGDGLIDDLLPAKLLGMQTLLVSPFADAHASL